MYFVSFIGLSNRRSLEPVPSDLDDDDGLDYSGVVPSTPPPLKKVGDTHTCTLCAALE